MERETAPETAIAFYTALADAEAALSELEAAGVPYPLIRMGTHTPEDLDRSAIAERASLASITLPASFWSLTVVLEPQRADRGMEVLTRHQPFAIGSMPGHERSDPKRGAIAWRHYVFESQAATDWAGESAGTTGTTGITTSGAFANDALVKDKPPAASGPAGDQQPPRQRQAPSSDTMRPDTSTDRSRPETELKE